MKGQRTQKKVQILELENSKRKKQKSHMWVTSWMTPKTTILIYFEMWTMIQGRQTPLPLIT